MYFVPSRLNPIASASSIGNTSCQIRLSAPLVFRNLLPVALRYKFRSSISLYQRRGGGVSAGAGASVSGFDEEVRRGALGPGDVCEVHETYDPGLIQVRSLSSKIFRTFMITFFS